MIKKIKDQFPELNRETLDTDKKISISYNESISEIYYALGREMALIEIAKLENELISDLISMPDNIIIAAGPGIPFHESFHRYILNKKPHVILLENSPENIYDNLKKRRFDMKERLTSPRSDFGVWDVGVMVDIIDNKLVELPAKIAINNIRRILSEREKIYTGYATLRFNSKEVLANYNLPQELLKIL